MLRPCRKFCLNFRAFSLQDSQISYENAMVKARYQSNYIHGTNVCCIKNTRIPVVLHVYMHQMCYL